MKKNTKTANLLYRASLWAVVCIVSLGVTAAFVYAPLWQSQHDIYPLQTFFAHTGDSVNINEATAEELRLLPGIGETRAKSIVEYRELNGPFVCVEELVYVPGIGEKTLEGLREYICV